MRLVVVLALAALVALIGAQVYSLYVQREALAEKSGKIEAQLQGLKRENQTLADDLEYFSNFDNLVKEFKSLFNYKKPGEKLIIIVPKAKQ